MDEQLWDDHYKLNVDKAKSIIEESFPELKILSITYIGSGMDFNSFEVNSKWIFRFPKREEYNELYNNEIKVMKQIGPLLSLETPDYCFVSESCIGFPLTVGGYKKLEGVFLMDLKADEYATEENAKIIGTFLSSLHSKNIKEKVEKISVVKEGRVSIQEFREETVEYLSESKSSMSHGLWSKYNELINEVSASTFEGESVLIHNDLGVEHIILDESSKTISGIIDWTDMAIGDPAADFAGIWATDKSFYNMIMAHYSAPVDAEFHKRVEQRGVYTLIGDSLYGSNLDEKKRISWCLDSLRNNFS